MSNSVQPHRQQPTRLPRLWDSPSKNTGICCHCLLQCMKVKSEKEVAQLCPTFSDPMDYSLPGSSIHGIFQGRVLEWGAIAFSAKSTYSMIILVVIGKEVSVREVVEKTIQDNNSDVNSGYLMSGTGYPVFKPHNNCVR